MNGQHCCHHCGKPLLSGISDVCSHCITAMTSDVESHCSALNVDEAAQILESLRTSFETSAPPAQITPPTDFSPGDTVRVIHGPFTGFHGVVDQLEELDRALVSLELFGRTIAVQLRTAALRRP